MSGRAVVIILDSVGIGGAPDAGKFGDEGVKIVTNHVIFDKWTRNNQIIELLGKILEKKGSRNRERP